MAEFVIGDTIGGKYEIVQVLGGRMAGGGVHSGMGVVYVALSRRENDLAYAIKTFQERRASPTAFRHEALIWVALGRHPHCVQAKWVEELYGRPFIVMEYIAPDARGRNRLTQFLVDRPLPINQTLRWATEFCLGMKHANSKGLSCHADIKPDNLLISQRGLLKIADFGLALAAIDPSSLTPSGVVHDTGSRTIDELTSKGRACGTPGYMAPEVINGEGTSERSDIFSFGIVLYQMLSGARHSPFHGLDVENGLSRVRSYDSPLADIVAKCTSSHPRNRFSGFAELQEEISERYQKITGRQVPQIVNDEMSAADWDNRGHSLQTLGRPAEAIACHDKAVALNRNDSRAWLNRGAALTMLGRLDEAIQSFNQAIAVVPGLPEAWHNKGAALHKLGHLGEANACFDRALALDPSLPEPWMAKGIAVFETEPDTAIEFFSRALSLDPYQSDLWVRKALALCAMDRREEAIACYDKALATESRMPDVVWNSKGVNFQSLGRWEEALHCHTMALAIDSKKSEYFLNKGIALVQLGRVDEAVHCYTAGLDVTPLDAKIWTNKGVALEALGSFLDALTCYERAVQIDPSDSKAWCNCGNVLAGMSRLREAVQCYARAVELDPRDAITFFNQAMVFEFLGDTRSAYKSYHSVMETASSSNPELLSLASARIRALEEA